MFMGTESNICLLSVCTQDVFIEIYVQSFCNKQLIETMNKKMCVSCFIKLLKKIYVGLEQHSNKYDTFENTGMRVKHEPVQEEEEEG